MCRKASGDLHGDGAKHLIERLRANTLDLELSMSSPPGEKVPLRDTGFMIDRARDNRRYSECLETNL